MSGLHNQGEFETIKTEDVIQEQTKDAFCCLKRTEIDDDQRSSFKINKEGFLIRNSSLDGADQIVVPRSLRNRVIHTSHYPKSAGHPGRRKMYYTLRRHYYWPQMTSEVYSAARNCQLCAKERIQLRKHASKLKLFPATAPLESVALELLGPLPKTRRGHNYLLVITDRYTKLTMADQSKILAQLSAHMHSAPIGRLFMDHLKLC